MVEGGVGLSDSARATASGMPCDFAREGVVNLPSHPTMSHMGAVYIVLPCVHQSRSGLSRSHGQRMVERRRRDELSGLRRARRALRNMSAAPKISDVHRRQSIGSASESLLKIGPAADSSRTLRNPHELPDKSCTNHGTYRMNGARRPSIIESLCSGGKEGGLRCSNSKNRRLQSQSRRPS